MKDTIIKSLQALTARPEAFSVLGTVEAINENELTCDVAQLLEQPDLYGVSLMPRDKDGNVKKGFLQIPKIGSVVVVSFINSQDAGFVSLFSEVDFVYLNGKNYGGLIQVEKLVEKVNKIEDLLNDLASKYNTHTHVIPTLVTACGAGAGSTTPSTAPATSATESTVLVKTTKADLENITVLHGNAQ